MYNQTFDPAAFAAAFAAAKDLNPPYIGPGTHKLALVSFENKNIKDKGAAMTASFVVVESPCHPVGSLVSAFWSLWDSRFVEKTMSAIKGFVEAVGGSTDPAEVQRNGTSMLTQNSARGVLVTAMGINAMEGQFEADGVTPKVFIKPSFRHVEGQTPETIAAQRAWVDSIDPPRPVAVAAAPSQPQYAAPVAAPAVAVAPAALPPAPVAVAPAPAALLPPAAPVADAPAPAAAPAAPAATPPFPTF